MDELLAAYRELQKIKSLPDEYQFIWACGCIISGVLIFFVFQTPLALFIYCIGILCFGLCLTLPSKATLHSKQYMKIVRLKAQNKDALLALTVSGELTADEINELLSIGH